MKIYQVLKTQKIIMKLQYKQLYRMFLNKTYKKMVKMTFHKQSKSIRKLIVMKVDFLDQDMQLEGLLDPEMLVVHKELDLLQRLLYLDKMILQVYTEVHKMLSMQIILEKDLLNNSQLLNQENSNQLKEQKMKLLIKESERLLMLILLRWTCKIIK